jgi:hypothetical protein
MIEAGHKQRLSKPVQLHGPWTPCCTETLACPVNNVSSLYVGVLDYSVDRAALVFVVSLESAFDALQEVR